MRGRLTYSKMMLYHNILRSDERRPIRKIVLEQEKEVRRTTWLSNVLSEIKTYDITLDPKVSEVIMEERSEEEDNRKNGGSNQRKMS